MFDIGFLEMVVAAVVALLVLGPDKLPGAVRMAGLYIGRIKRSMAEVRSQVEREIGADELRQTLHNEKIMAELTKKPGSSNVNRSAAQNKDSKDEPAATEPAATDTPAPQATSSAPDSDAASDDDPNTRT